MKRIIAILALFCSGAQAYTLTLTCPDVGGVCVFSGPSITTTPNPPPTNAAPSGCVAVGGATVQVGTPVTLSAGCSVNGSSVTAWQWKMANTVVGNGTPFTFTPATATTYVLYATATYAGGAVDTSAVSVIATNAPTTPPAPSTGCAPYGTVVDRGQLPHPANGATYIFSNGEVTRFTVQETDSYRSNSIAVAEFQAQKTMYTVGISESPDCGPFLPGGGINTTNSITYRWASPIAFPGNPNIGQPGSNYAAVLPNKTYYLYIYFRDGLPGTRQTCNVDCNFILTTQ